MFVRIDTSVDDIVEQIVHDVCESLGGQHTMKSANEHSLLWIQSLRRLLHVVAVTQDPRYYLYLHRTQQLRHPYVVSPVPVLNETITSPVRGITCTCIEHITGVHVICTSTDGCFDQAVAGTWNPR